MSRLAALLRSYLERGLLADQFFPLLTQSLDLFFQADGVGVEGAVLLVVLPQGLVALVQEVLPAARQLPQARVGGLRKRRGQGRSRLRYSALPRLPTASGAVSFVCGARGSTRTATEPVTRARRVSCAGAQAR